ncbi:MAG: low molecular weight protein-tyrosine-phosphatase [Bacteroidota bacterium]|nr:low molecular weight protein-tyrosine-phosphatase [Bacteroidota bacterium]
MKILMVCLGNICRSPLAEGILQEKAFRAGLNWSVESAGTNSYHIGDPPHHLSQKVAQLNGIDISRQRARRFVPEDFEVYDKIYALAGDVLSDIRHIARNKFNSSKIDLLMNELYPGGDKDVPDPWYHEEPAYHEVYKLLDEVCDAIIRKATVSTPGRILQTPKGALQASSNLKTQIPKRASL